MRSPYLPTPDSITPTKDARVRIAGYGPGNWRTEVPTGDGLTEWDITGPAYATKAEALANVDYALYVAYGQAMPASAGTVYAVHATIGTSADNGYRGARTVPTFYLDSRVQGIVSAEHAARVAADILNPLGLIAAGDLHIGAYPVDMARENAALDAFARDSKWSGEYEQDGTPVPLSAFAGNPGHVCARAGCRTAAHLASAARTV